MITKKTKMKKKKKKGVCRSEASSPVPTTASHAKIYAPTPR